MRQKLLQFLLIIIIIVTSLTRNVSGATNDVTNTTKDEITAEDFLLAYDDIVDGVYSRYPNYDHSIDDIPPPRGSTADMVQGFVGRPHLIVTSRVDVLVRTMRIMKMDVEQQSVDIKVEESFGWDDLSLDLNHTGPVSNGTDAVPIKTVFYEKDRIWTPPIYAKNVLDEKVIHDSDGVFCWNTGSCFIVRYVQYTIPCEVNVRDFPFDVHNCTLILSQPDRWNLRLNFSTYFNKRRGQDAETYRDYIYNQQGEHQEWSLKDWDNQIITHPDKTHLNEFKYTLVLRRQASFYFTVLIMPCILLNLLSLTVFTLSVTDTGRMDFCLALILTYFVLIMIVVDSSPPSGDQIPMLGLYIILSTGVVAVTFGMSMVLVEIHEHFREKGKRMPRIMSLVLEKYCCLDRRFKAYKSRRGIGEENEKDKEAFLNNYSRDTESPTDKQLLEMFKWKLLGKILNFVFLVITILEHIGIGFTVIF